MEKTKLTDRHFCYVIFSEMHPSDFISLMKTNHMVENLIFLDDKKNIDLYNEAKDLISQKENGQIFCDFVSQSEPFIFDKYINGKFDRTYKICIFEVGQEPIYIGKTSGIYFDGMPQFFDFSGNIVKNSLN